MQPLNWCSKPVIEAKQFESIEKRNSQHEKVYEQSEYTVMIKLFFIDGGSSCLETHRGCWVWA